MTDDEIYEYLGQVFEWDRVKAARNAIRHRVRFPEAASVFLDFGAEYFVDEVHSDEEQRYTVIGWSAKARSLLVVHAWRGPRIRIISARKATPSERSQYDDEVDR